MRLEHILSTSQFLDRALLDDLLALADHFRTAKRERVIPRHFEGKLLASLFYEPSTRTRLSFEAAMRRLGGEVITTESAGHFSSAVKGETLEDTIRVIGGYVDAIVLRHPEIGAAARAASVSPVPIINAGDGAGEHPSQALLDLYTIKTELGRLEGFTIALVGDLLFGRTIHSLVRLLTLLRGVTVLLVAPQELGIPAEYIELLRAHDIPVHQVDDVRHAAACADVLYVTRIQKERLPPNLDPETVRDAFIVDQSVLDVLLQRSIIMHPLPRVRELPPAVDADPRAAYFRQAHYGLFVRMALLSRILAS